MRTKPSRLMLPILVTLGALLVGEIALAGERLHGGAFDPGIYPTPHPVPSWVGVTPYNYQPLYPHEMLHKHYKVWKRYDGRSRIIPSNTTRVLYW